VANGGIELIPADALLRADLIDAACCWLHCICRWVAEEDHIVNFPTVRLKRGMPIRLTSKD